MKKKGKTRIRRKNMGIKILLLIILLIFIIIKFIVPGSITLAKYTYSKVRNYYLTSKAFYFNSDKLNDEIRNEETGEKGAYFEAGNWSGIDEYRVDISLNSKKNSIEGAKVDIPYEIEYDYQIYHADGTKYTGEPKDIVNFTIEKTTGKIFVESNNIDYFYFEILPKIKLEDNDYILIHITARSTSPYKKELFGTFKISIGNLGMKYEIKDAKYNPYLDFTVTNTLNYYTVKETFTDTEKSYNVGDQIPIPEYLKLLEENKKKCKSLTLKLDFDPNKVVIDTTSAIYLSAKEHNVESIGGYDYVNTITFDVEAEESKTVRFYKKDALQDYTYPGTGNSIIKVTQQ